MVPEEELSKEKKRRNILIALVALLAAVNVFQFVANYRKEKQNQTLVVTTKHITDQLGAARASLDSLNQELTLKINQVAKLGGDTTNLGLIRKELMKDLSKARKLRGSDKKRLAQLREKIEAYAIQLNAKDEEIVKLVSQRDRLAVVNLSLKTDIVKRDDSIRTIELTRNELAKKVAVASVLKAENLRSTYLDSRGNERDDDIIRSRRLEKIKITFQIADNKVAPVGTKDVYLRVIEPDGAILSDAALGGGTFLTQDGADIPYTLRQSFIFDNQMPRITFIYGKGGEYKPGGYKYEVYNEGYKVGEGGFVVK